MKNVSCFYQNVMFIFLHLYYIVVITKIKKFNGWDKKELKSG